MKAGQQVVCIKRDDWVTVTGPEILGDNPLFNEIVTIRRVVWRAGMKFLVFREYPKRSGYGARWFRPVMSTENLIKELKSTSEVGAIPAGS